MMMTAQEARELQQDSNKAVLTDLIYSEMNIRIACLDNQNSTVYQTLHTLYVPGIIHALEKAGFKCEPIEPDKIKIEW